jgi:hypothetical protein
MGRIHSGNGYRYWSYRYARYSDRLKPEQYPTRAKAKIP